MSNMQQTRAQCYKTVVMLNSAEQKIYPTKNVNFKLWNHENSFDSGYFHIHVPFKFEPCSEKTGLRDFRPGPTQSTLYSHIRWLEA